jgi:hypothetical protein
MPSGAGHDAMKLHEIMPQAMLFVRGGTAASATTRWKPPPPTTCNCPSMPSPTSSTNSRTAMTNMNQDKQATYAALDAWIDSTSMKK